MLRPIVNIVFTSKKTGARVGFDFCTSVEIVESYEDLTKTATVVLPRKIVFQGKDLFTGANAIFRRGDKVLIELGYFKEENTPLEGLKQLFTGYISYVNGSLPVTIECEDEMFVLKQTNITFSAKKISLKDLMKAILPTDIYNAGKFLDIPNMGDVTYSNASVPQILDKLKSQGLYARFVDGILNVGFASDASDTKTQEFIFERTIIDDSGLKYQLKEDISLKVTAIAMQDDNSKKEITVGDPDGAQKTFYMYGADEAALKQFANLKLDRARYTGYTGSFDTFGEPMVRAGDIAQLTSRKLPERNGFYDVVTVRRKFSVNEGYRQNIEIGQYFGASQSEALANLPK